MSPVPPSRSGHDLEMDSLRNALHGWAEDSGVTAHAADRRERLVPRPSPVADVRFSNICAPSHSETTTAMRMRAANGCLEDFALLNDLWILQLDKLPAVGAGASHGMWDDTSPWVSWAKLSDNYFSEMGQPPTARLPFNFHGQTVGTREFRTWPSARSGAAMSFIDNTPNYETLVNMAH